MASQKQPDIETAIRIYYQYTEIGNTQIRELFQGVSDPVIVRRKKEARAVMIEQGKATWDPNSVNTQCAFEAWKLDIADLEMRWAKLKKLGFVKQDVS